LAAWRGKAGSKPALPSDFQDVIRLNFLDALGPYNPSKNRN